MQGAVSIGFLLFPQLLQLDFTGPYGLLAAGSSCSLHTVWKDLSPLHSSDGLRLQATCTFVDCPQLDVLCIPGGAGVVPLLCDQEVLSFVRMQAKAARFVTSVCTGALLLGAAGLLDGYQATTHWMSLDLLALFNAVPVAKRVVEDRNRITAAGVSAGLDMALLLAGKLWGDAAAQRIQLQMEYAPEPPYESGTPATAPSAVVKALQASNQDRQEKRLQAVRKAAAALNLLAL